MPAKKYAVWAVAAFAVLYLVKSPTQAAGTVDSAASGLASIAGSVATFLNELGT